MKNIIRVTFLILLISSNLSMAQETEHKLDSHQNDSIDNDENHDEMKKHSLFLEFGYTHIPDAYEQISGDQDIWIPTLGLAYLYYFNHKWSAGLMVNLELESYLLSYNNKDLVRDNVLIIAAVAKFEIMHNWAVFAGPGIEIEEHHNFAVFRFGTEYNVPLPKNWFLAPVLTFDYKEEYTTFDFAIGIGKRF